MYRYRGIVDIDICQPKSVNPFHETGNCTSVQTLKVAEENTLHLDKHNIYIPFPGRVVLKCRTTG